MKKLVSLVLVAALTMGCFRDVPQRESHQVLREKTRLNRKLQ